MDKLKRDTLYTIVIFTLFMMSISLDLIPVMDNSFVLKAVAALSASITLYYFINKYIGRYLQDMKREHLEPLQSELQVSQKFQNIFNASEEIIVISNGNQIVEANSKALDFFGFDSLEEFRSHYSCVCNLFVEKEGYLYSKVGQEIWLDYILKDSNKAHKVVMHSNSKEYIFLVNAKRLNKTLKDEYVVYFRDITQFENITLQFKYAVEGSNDGLWDWNLKDNTLYFSPRWKEMIGYKDDELANEYGSWESRVHPDDLPKALEEVSLCQSDPTHKYDMAMRLLHKDGHWIWILARGQVIFDEDSKPIRMIGFHTDISKLKELENSLYEAKHKFDLFMENIPYAIVMRDENSQIIYANARESEPYKTFIEASNREVERKVQFLIDRSHLEDKVEEVVVIDVEGRSYITRVLAFSIKQNFEKIYTGLICVDITHRYSAQDEIRRLRSTLENSPIAIMTVNLEGNIEYVNSMYSKVCGYTREELIGVNPKIFKSGYTSDDEYKRMYETLNRGETWHGNFKNIKKDGSEYWESVTIVPTYDYEMNIDGYIAFKVEITENIFLEEKLMEQEKMIIAQSRHAAMGEMISMIAHQWRQPISIISMDANNIIADIELEMLDEETLREGCTDIINQTQELSKTIDDFRNFFRPQKERDTISFREILDDTMNIIGKSLDNNLISIEIEIDDRYSITTYSRELMQVFINIIKNAKEVLVERDIKDKKISISVKKELDKFEVMICDNGGGVEKSLIEKIFHPYFTTKSDKNGTGLGLYMSKTIVEKHLQGTIKVSNKEGCRACFILTLPESLEVN